MFDASLIYGIASMLGFGFSGYFASIAVRREDAVKVASWGSVAGILLLLLFAGFYQSPHAPTSAFLLLLLAAFAGAVGYLSFLRGIRVGKLSIVSPLASSWSLITVVLSLTFLSQRLTSLQPLGIALVIAGTVLVSFKLKELKRLRFSELEKGVRYGFLTMLMYASQSFIIALIVPTLGWFLPIFAIVVLNSATYFAVSRAVNKTMLPSKSSIPFIVLSGALTTAGFLSYGVGVTYGKAAIVAPLSAAQAFVTVLLALVIVKEKLEAEQGIGVACILAGVVLLSL